MQLIDSHAQLRSADDRADAAAAAAAAELSGAAASVEEFRVALRGSEQTLAALMSERGALQLQVS